MQKRVLIVHNKYKMSGGEDMVVVNETNLLKKMGYEVSEYIRSNDEISSTNIIGRCFFLLNAIFSIRSYFDVARIIKNEKIDIMHVHNTWAIISPSVYYAAFKAHIPVIQTIHNFRLLCPNGFLMRGGVICEDCISGNLYNSVKNRCYRKSMLQTLVLLTMLTIHRRIGTYNKLNYVCLSEFNKKKLLELNKKKGVHISEEQIFVKPNFI